MAKKKAAPTKQRSSGAKSAPRKGPSPAKKKSAPAKAPAKKNASKAPVKKTAAKASAKKSAPAKAAAGKKGKEVKKAPVKKAAPVKAKPAPKPAPKAAPKKVAPAKPTPKAPVKAAPAAKTAAPAAPKAAPAKAPAPAKAVAPAKPAPAAKAPEPPKAPAPPAKGGRVAKPKEPIIAVMTGIEPLGAPVRQLKRALKERFQLEFYLRATPGSLYDMMSTPSGLSEWFCSDVNVRGDEFTFVWGNDSQVAQCLSRKYGELIRFRWEDDEDPGAYFELRIRIDSMTNETCLVVTDHAWPKDLEEAKALWDSQIHALGRVLGA